MNNIEVFFYYFYSFVNELIFVSYG